MNIIRIMPKGGECGKKTKKKKRYQVVMRVNEKTGKFVSQCKCEEGVDCKPSTKKHPLKKLDRYYTVKK